jgi:hypothetical protein
VAFVPRSTEIKPFCSAGKSSLFLLTALQTLESNCSAIGCAGWQSSVIFALSGFIVKIPNSIDNVDLKKGKQVDIGWMSEDCLALDG